MATAVRPTLHALSDEGIEYRGVLYAGLMLTSDGPKVLEYNVRFGDPECQVVVPRLASDLGELCRAAAAGEPLPEIDFVDDACVTVVLATEGYPVAPRTGDVIEGLETRRAHAATSSCSTRARAGRMVPWSPREDGCSTSTRARPDTRRRPRPRLRGRRRDHVAGRAPPPRHRRQPCRGPHRRSTVDGRTLVLPEVRGALLRAAHRRHRAPPLARARARRQRRARSPRTAPACAGGSEERGTPRRRGRRNPRTDRPRAR